MTVTQVAEVAITAPVGSATIYYLPLSTTNFAATESNTGAGVFSGFSTQDYTIYGIKIVGGINYLYTTATAQYTEMSGNTYDVSLTWDLMANADGYFINNTSSGQWYTTDSVTNTVYDNGTGGGTPTYTLFSAPFLATGQTINFEPVGRGTSPSGASYYSAPGSSYGITDSVNDSTTNFFVIHSFTSVPA